MKLIESEADLQNWETYKDFMKVQLKLLDGGGAPCFVSKDKVSFDLDGSPWNGVAFLAGPKATICMRNLKKDGVTLREGTCSREGKVLQIDGLDPKFVKAAAKTLKKLVLGYKIRGAEEESDDEAASEGAAPEVRAKRMQDLHKLSSDLDRLLAALNKK
jgi:hypothetical protein